jgi:hypothetical protein
MGGTLVAEDMMEGVRQAIQTLGVKGLTTVGITSSLRGEGRTTLALATALVLAEYGMETILLELDLAHPELCHRLGVSKYPGLLDVAEGRADVADAMHPFSPGVSIVPVGQMQGSIPRALSQLAKSELLSELASQGDAQGIAQWDQVARSRLGSSTVWDLISRGLGTGYPRSRGRDRVATPASRQGCRRRAVRRNRPDARL